MTVTENVVLLGKFVDTSEVEDRERGVVRDVEVLDDEESTSRVVVIRSLSRLSTLVVVKEAVEDMEDKFSLIDV